MAVATERSFSRAAQLLHISQPAVSQQIAALEAELGVDLIERTRPALQLTAAGQTLKMQAEALLRQMADIRRELLTVQGEIAGSLGIAASFTLGEYVLPRYLADFARTQPRLQVRLTVENSERVIQDLLSGEADLGFVEGPTETAGILLTPLHEDEMVVVMAPARARGYDSGEITLAQAVREPFVLRERGSGTRQVLEQYLAAADIEVSSLKVIMELSGTEPVKSAVEADAGISVLSRSVIAKELRLGTLAALRVSDLPMRRALSLAQVRGRVLLPAARAFLGYVRTELAREDTAMTPH